jgi:tetratricopeptide (TPR) repeat protein
MNSSFSLKLFSQTTFKRALNFTRKIIGFIFVTFYLTACANFSLDTVNNEPASSNTAETSTQNSDSDLEGNSKGTSDGRSDESTDESLAGATVQKVLTLSPYKLSDEVIDPSKKQSFQNGVLALNEQDFLRAQSLFENIVQTHPKHSGAKLNLALALIGQEQHQAAIDMLKLAILDNPNNIHALNQLAILQRQQGQFDQAKLNWLAALTKWPDYAQAHYNLGILYDLYLGQFDLALNHYQQYQTYQEKPDRLVRAWVADIERRINSQAVND